MMLIKSPNCAAAKCLHFRVTEWEDLVGQTCFSANTVVYIVTHKSTWNVAMRSKAGMAKRQADVDLRETQVSAHQLTLWLGLAWFGLAWLGLAWLGLAWLGLAWLGYVVCNGNDKKDTKRKRALQHAFKIDRPIILTYVIHRWICNQLNLQENKAGTEQVEEM